MVRFRSKRDSLVELALAYFGDTQMATAKVELRQVGMVAPKRADESVRQESAV